MSLFIVKNKESNQPIYIIIVEVEKNSNQNSNFAPCVQNYLFLKSFIQNKMWDYIINIHPSDLLSTKTKESIINEL